MSDDEIYVFDRSKPGASAAVAASLAVPKEEDDPSILSEEEIERLLHAWFEGFPSDEVRFTHADLMSVLNWGNMAVVYKGLWENVQDGRIAIRLNDDGEPTFSHKGD